MSLVWSVFIFSPQLQCNWPSFFFLSAHCMLKIDRISHHNRSCRCEEIRHVWLETNQSTNQQLPHFSTNRELKCKTFCTDTFAAAIKFIHRSCELGYIDDEGRADELKHWTFFFHVAALFSHNINELNQQMWRSTTGPTLSEGTRITPAPTC